MTPAELTAEAIRLAGGDPERTVDRRRHQRVKADVKARLADMWAAHLTHSFPAARDALPPRGRT